MYAWNIYECYSIVALLFLPILGVLWIDNKTTWFGKERAGAKGDFSSIWSTY